jgi:hypothetical protein
VYETCVWHAHVMPAAGCSIVTSGLHQKGAFTRGRRRAKARDITA